MRGFFVGGIWMRSADLENRLVDGADGKIHAAGEIGARQIGTFKYQPASLQKITGMSCIRIIVRGLVQGVYFRASTRERAEELGLTGEVRNLGDGSVEVVACGTAEQLQVLVDWCRVGPPHARVEEVEVTELADRQFSGFSVLRGRG